MDYCNNYHKNCSESNILFEIINLGRNDVNERLCTMEIRNKYLPELQMMRGHPIGRGR
jgi:hypothetical protein